MDNNGNVSCLFIVIVYIYIYIAIWSECWTGSSWSTFQFNINCVVTFNSTPCLLPANPTHMPHKFEIIYNFKNPTKCFNTTAMCVSIVFRLSVALFSKCPQ